MTLAPVRDWDSLGQTWRELETCADLSFFQSWTWLGCLAGERFTRPLLLRAEHDGAVVALALFNRRGGRLLLGETGVAEQDAVFVEHNGPVFARDAGDDVRSAFLRAIRDRRVALSGVGEEIAGAMTALPGLLRRRRTRPAPFVDLDALPESFEDSLGPNTRYQLRRSDRSYARRGALRIRRATGAAEAQDFLAALAFSHGRYWEGRGQPGAFVNPHFARFHRALVDRRLSEVDLLRVDAGETVIGHLYNFVHRGHVYAYQSGFDYASAERHEKPGLTCHRLAIELYRAEGMRRYDFLAGDDRYKTSFANASAALHWLEYFPRFSAGWLLQSCRRALG